MRRLFLSMCCCLLLAACGGVPTPAQYGYTSQRKMQAIRHWEVLAKDSVKGMAPALQGFPVCLETRDPSPFGRSFSTLLVTELTSGGFPVTREKDGAVVLDWSVTVVEHAAHRENPGIPFKNTILAVPLAWGFTKAFSETGTKRIANSFMPALASAAVMSDLTRQFDVDVPHTEILITLTASMGETVLRRETGTYYINDEDRDHYRSIPDRWVTPPEPLPDKTYQVVGQ